MATEMQTGKPVNLVCSGLHGLPLVTAAASQRENESEQGRRRRLNRS